MRFKKFFAVLSAVSMLATVSAVNVSASATMPIMPIDSAQDNYTLDYDVVDGGVVVSKVNINADGVGIVEIPSENEEGQKVIGVGDFAFADADVSVIVVPDTLQAEYIGEVAFLTKQDIKEYIMETAGIDASEYTEATYEDASAKLGTKALTYAANAVGFKGKTDWKGDEEELEEAGEVLSNVQDILAGENKEYTADQLVVDLWSIQDDAVVVREDDAAAGDYRMSQKSYDNFKAWVKTIKYYGVTLTGKGDTDISKYAVGKELLGMEWKENIHVLRGDANHDGEVNVRDAAFIANRLANEKGDELCECADYNEDGEINVRDAAAIAKDLAKATA